MTKTESNDSSLWGRIGFCRKAATEGHRDRHLPLTKTSLYSIADTALLFDALLAFHACHGGPIGRAAGEMSERFAPPGPEPWTVQDGIELYDFTAEEMSFMHEAVWFVDGLQHHK